MDTTDPVLRHCQASLSSIGLNPAGVASLLCRCGVTRVAGLTGLDTTSVPVWSCVRPASRSLAVSFGKGVTEKQAQISAIMEALESSFAEKCLDYIYCRASVNELARGSVQIVPLQKMSRCNTIDLDNDTRLRWLQGHSVLGGVATLAPVELIGLDYTDNDAAKCMTMTSVGLAAHTSKDGAALHALLELIEHHTIAQIDSLPGFPDILPRFKSDQIPTVIQAAIDDLCLRQESPMFFAAPGFAGTKTVVCTISKRQNDPKGRFGRCLGMACRPDSESAALAALVEAAQVRMTLIAGSREDLAAHHYTQSEVRQPFRASDSDWDDAEGTQSSDPRSLLESIVLRMKDVGYDEPVVFELTDQSEIVQVIRLLGPGLSCGADSSRSLGIDAIRVILSLPCQLQ